MDDAREDGLIEALGNVERLGDVAPASDTSPAAAVLRQRVEHLGLAVWDPEEGRLFLTSYGRERMVARQRRLSGERGVVLQFARRSTDRAQVVATHRSGSDRPAPRTAKDDAAAERDASA